MDELHVYASTHQGVFTIADARKIGLTDKQIRHRREREWRRLYEGVYLAGGAPLTPRAALRAACLAGAPNAAVSHRAAAALYDVPGGRLNIAEITCPRWLRVVHPALVVHESTLIPPEDVQEIDGILVMRPERVLIELAGIYRSPDFIETVLHAMRRKRLVTLDSSRATLNRLAKRGRRGIRVVRAVLDRWDPSERVTESPAETTLLQILRDAGLGRVVPQFEVFDAAARSWPAATSACPTYERSSSTTATSFIPTKSRGRVTIGAARAHPGSRMACGRGAAPRPSRRRTRARCAGSVLLSDRNRRDSRPSEGPQSRKFGIGADVVERHGRAGAADIRGVGVADEDEGVGQPFVGQCRARRARLRGRRSVPRPSRTRGCGRRPRP